MVQCFVCKRVIPRYWMVSIFILICLSFPTIVNGQSIYINEFLASNTTINPDIIDFDDYSDWLEIYNDGNSAVDLSGFYLTDNLNNPTKWQIPQGTTIGAKGFLLFWADGYDEVPGKRYTRSAEPHQNFYTSYYHLNFKLSRAAEQIGIFDSEGNAVDTVSFGTQFPDVAYGRDPDGSGNWLYFGEPTPGASNITSGVRTPEFGGSVAFSVPGGFYPSGQIISLTASATPSEIRYTTDGSCPGSSAHLYSGPITVSSTKVIRARVFEQNKLPGPIVTRSYLINENPTLPAVSIAAYPETMFGEQIGIYSNLLKSREIPVSFEFFEPENNAGFAVDAGLRLSGQGSFYYPQKSLTISTDDRFGAEEIEYQIFKDVDIHSFKDVYLRNSGCADNRHTMFRDALQNCIVANQMDIDYQAYQPAMAFINGNYWGIYNLREKMNTNYLAAHHNVDPGNIDFLEYDFGADPVLVVVEGDNQDYTELLSFIENNTLTLDENYQYVKTQIDIDELINYMITEIYCDNINWPYTNMRWWREKRAGSKWRWILVDMDWGFGMPYPNFSSHYSSNSLELAVSGAGSHSESFPWSTVLFRKLFGNDEFRSEFIQRFSVYLNTVFKQERVVGIVDSLATLIYPEMRRHIPRWNANPQVLIYNDPPIPDIAAWSQSVQIMRDFARMRPSYQWQHLRSFFILGGTRSFTIEAASDLGHVSIAGVPVRDGYNGRHYIDVPFQVCAVPKAGYRFVRWEGDATGSNDTIMVTLTDDASLRAIFEPSDERALPAVIAEDLTLTKANSPYYAAGDVVVESPAGLTIEAGVEIKMPESGSIYIYGSITVAGNATDPVIIRPNSEAGAVQWGSLCFVNAADSSHVAHLRITGASNGNDPKKYMGAISAYQSDVIIEHAVIEDSPFPIFIQYGNVIIRDCILHSEKICDMINVKYAESALVENCEFSGNISQDVDAIDFDGITGGIIRGNRIYNFYGSNCDGIDLGEASTDILIENNLIVNCSDKGISVGQASTAVIRGNVIVNCNQGAGIKDTGSYAFVDGNTFYGVNFGIACFEKNPGAGGGAADVTNNIFSQSRTESVFADGLSSVNVTYCISDTDSLEGTGNRRSDPLLGNNHALKAGSPAIDMGDPGSSTDPDGSRRDIGAKPFNESDISWVIVDEIHYNPAEGDGNEFIELLNTGSDDIDLSSWSLSGAVDFIFPAGTIIAPDECVVIAANSGVYAGQGYQVFQWSEGSLPDSWGILELSDETQMSKDLIYYNSSNGWATTPNGSGPSLEFRKGRFENLYFASWKASQTNGGSPGKKAGVSKIAGLYINEIMAVNGSTIEDENGQYDDWIEIYNDTDQAIDLGGLYITDDFSQPLKCQIPITNASGTTIQPKNFVLLWADEDKSQGELHLNFKLGSTGEQIGIYQIIEGIPVLIDHLEFGLQTKDVSYGRADDGGNEWIYMSIASPGCQNVKTGRFEKGVLLVNGVEFQTYGQEITSAYTNEVFTGDYPIDFWDCFEAPEGGYPENLPEPTGHGAIPEKLLHQYSTVIWIGNNYNGDLAAWGKTDIMSYLETGGNCLLITRMGQKFLNDDWADYLGIAWDQMESNEIKNCIAVGNGMRAMGFSGEQTLVAVFKQNFTNSESSLLFKETVSFQHDCGLGVWHKPESGGTHKSDGGQFVFISGRPYRYEHDDLRLNMEYILGNFFHESLTTLVEEVETVADKFSLRQNYPNPFNSSTTIQFSLPEKSAVNIKIYNVAGKLVRTLINESNFSAGVHGKSWDSLDQYGNTVSTGIYLYTIETEKFTETRKMLLLR